jgi:hypothetical protein
MGTVLQFPKNRNVDPNILKLKEVSDQLDRVLIGALEDDVDAHELSGLVAHRLGNLIKNLDEKSKLWLVCEKVLKRQANIS